jgi:ferric-chelate reductase
MVLRNGIPKDSLLAMVSVKLQKGRPDLSALLRDEVELATGGMSVSRQSSSPHLQIKIIPILLLVWLADDSLICLWYSSVSSVQPLSVANGGPSVTLHIESWLRLT